MPPLLLAGALLFWGWESQRLPLASAMALALELRWLTPWRLRLAPADFTKAADMCVVLFLGAALYLFLTPEAGALAMGLASWSPGCLFPLVAAQVFATVQSVRWDWLAHLPGRKRREASLARRGESGSGPPLPLDWLYFGACLFATGAANDRSPWTFAGMFGLTAWALWAARPRRFRFVAWLAILAACGVVAFGARAGIEDVQARVRGWAWGRYANPFTSRTAIGDMGDFKLSREIALRVVPDGSGPPPRLLREASYDFYGHGSWLASNATFQTIEPELKDRTAWALQPDVAPSRSVAVYQFFQGRMGLLALPAGAARISGLEADYIEVNPLGAVCEANAPHLVRCEIGYRPGTYFESRPGLVDMVTPPGERAQIEPFAQRLGLAGMDSRQAAAAIVAAFNRDFRYSLRLEPAGDEPLRDFLERRRAGHCEYFATAATLLLRAHGTPARYTVGWAVQEWSPTQQCFLVRRAHAHAWVQAFIDDAWVDVDPTPPVWLREDLGEPTWMDELADFRARASFAFARWRWLDKDSLAKRIMLWLIAPLALFLLYRLRRGGGLAAVRARERRRREAGLPGADSEFYRAAERLERRGHPRGQGESLGRWLERIDHEELREPLALHNALRFDPRGLGERARARLRELVARWLERQGR